MIRFNDPVAGARVAEMAQAPYGSGDVAISNHRDDGTLLGGVVLTNHTGASFFIHQAAHDPRWLTRDMLWAIFHYPFVQCGCRSLIGMTPSENAQALAVAMKVGFEVETVIRDCLPGGEHLIVTRMWRDKCRWLNWKPKSLICNQSMMVPGGLH